MESTDNGIVMIEEVAYCYGDGYPTVMLRMALRSEDDSISVVVKNQGPPDKDKDEIRFCADREGRKSPFVYYQLGILVELFPLDCNGHLKLEGEDGFVSIFLGKIDRDYHIKTCNPDQNVFAEAVVIFYRENVYYSQMKYLFRFIQTFMLDSSSKKHQG